MDESSSQAGAVDPAQARAVADAAMDDPRNYNAAVEAARTPAEREEAAAVLWAIEHPAEYFQQVVEPDPEYPQHRPAAEFSILNPVQATAQARAAMTTAQRAESDRVARGIENPGVRP